MPKLGPHATLTRNIITPRKAGLPTNLLLDEGPLAEDFENVGDWTKNSSNCTLAADTTYYKTGSQGINIKSTSGASVWMKKTVSLDLSKSEWVSLWIRPDTAQTNVNLWLSSDSGLTKYFRATYILLAEEGSGAWYHLKFNRSAFSNTGGESWNNTMTVLRIDMYPNDVGNGSATIDTFRTHMKTKGALLLSFDDFSSTVYHAGFRYTLGRGIRATAYLRSDRLDYDSGWPSTAMCQEMSAAGWDIGNHTTTHSLLSSLTEAQQETELSTCKSVLDGIGCTRASMHVAYPVGAYNADTLTAMANTGMLTGRLGTRLGSGNSYNSLYPPPGNHLFSLYHIPSRVAPDSNVLPTVKGWISDALDLGEVFCLYSHEINPNSKTGGHWTVADWKALCDWIVTLNIPTITISELYSLMTSEVMVNMPY